MTATKTRGRGLALLMALLMASWGAAGCGGKTTPDEDGDVDVVGDMPTDLVTDGDGPRDAPREDILVELDGVIEVEEVEAGDVPADGDATEGDVTPPPPQGFETESAGGALLSSEHYKLEVFVAPARPTGSGSSANYKVKLGPGGARSK